MICSVVSCFCSGRCVIVSAQHYHTLLSSVGVLVLYIALSQSAWKLRTCDSFMWNRDCCLVCASGDEQATPSENLASHNCMQYQPITQIGWVIWTESDHDRIALQLTYQMCMLWLTATQGDWHCFLIHFIFGTQLEHGSRRLSALSGSRQSFGGKQKENCKQSVVACSTMSLSLKISQPTKTKTMLTMLNLSQVYAYWTELTEQLIIWRCMPWAKQAILESRQSS